MEIHTKECSNYKYLHTVGACLKKGKNVLFLKWGNIGYPLAEGLGMGFTPRSTSGEAWPMTGAIDIIGAIHLVRNTQAVGNGHSPSGELEMQYT